MGKRGIILGLLVISILIISSVSFVSAGLLDDIWAGITGKVTENETGEDEVMPDPEPPVEDPSCGDGICQEGEVCDRDCCEQFCTLYCPEGAVEGSCGCECIEPEPPEPGEKVCCKIMIIAPGMTGAKIEYAQILKSECPPRELLDGTSYEIVDSGYCETSPPDDNDECEEGEINYYLCEDGTEIPGCACENGGWVCIISVKNACPDIDDEPETCAARIQITFNKDVYIIGDDVKIIIEIFDSQGNHLPNYAFYGQMYDDRWHTPDLQRTDSSGYLIHTGTAEKPGGGVTEVKFKVYTKETSSCGSVQDTGEVKFELGECGIGGCAPEPRCRDKIRMCGGECVPCPEEDDDNGGEIFYPCNGCELESKCYTYGYRKAGNYCSDENDVFVSQSGDDETCENNFECKTNLCIDSNCVSSNLLNKFFAWLRNMFGGGEEPGPKDCSKLLIEKDIGNYDYNQSLYDFKEGKVPLYSENGEQIEIIACCAAQYFSQEGEENMGMVCPFDNRADVENSINWLLIKNPNLVLGEYKGEKVLNDRNNVVAWTSNNYIVATGGRGEGVILTEEYIAGAYLDKYPNDLEEIDITVDGRVLPPLVFCTEEDEKATEECTNRGGNWGSDPSALDGTEEGKKRCIESKGFGEGCCEVYSGCTMPVELCEEIRDNMERAGCYIDVAISKGDFKICENIGINDRRNKCYVNVAEHTGNAGICDKVSDSSLREKCYFWVAEQGGEVSPCEQMADSSLQNECYAEVAEKTGDASFCDKIDDSHIGDKCYRDVGIQTNDASLCEEIIEDRAKQMCLDGTS